MRYFLEIAYNGSRYSGWQIQPNALTVQGVLEGELSKLYTTTIATVGCGRTDAGVHAAQFYAHFDTDLNPDFVVFRLNKMLPKDISIVRCIKVHSSAHARFDANERGYIYTMYNTKNAMFIDRSWWLDTTKFDYELLTRATNIIAQATDFSIFAKTGGNNLTTLCSIRKCEWHFNDNYIEFHINANRFLRGMVRRIVGALVNVAKGKLEVATLENCIKQNKNLFINTAAPPQGLILNHVSYSYIAC